MKYTFDPFTVSYDQIIEPVGSYKEECARAANTALKKNIMGMQPVVMMSGGIDSELVARSLQLADIQFNAVIGRLMTKIGHEKIIFNLSDTFYAEDWCYRNNIEIIFCDIDVFKENEKICEYAMSANCFSPQYGCHMYIMKWCNDNGLFFLAGNGEMDFILKDGKYVMRDEQREMSLNEFCTLNNLYGEFQFWKQDSRLISAFIELPAVRRMMKNCVVSLLDYKHDCYVDEFSIEQRKKKTGFELLQEWDYHLRTYMKQTKSKFDEKFYTPIGIFSVKNEG